MSKLIRISLDEARHRTETALANAGTAQPAARLTAEALFLAEADGQSGHGLVRLASYAAQAQRQGVRPCFTQARRNASGQRGS